MMKLRQGLVLLTSALLLAFIMPACNKNKKDNGPQEQAGKLAGLGETAGTPSGTDFTFPANISQAGIITGDYCDTTYAKGSGEFVDVCVAFFNSGTTDVTITLPAGLCILAENLEYQHGMVLQDTKILLKAGRITRCTLGSYCVNAHRKPSSSSVKYVYGKVSDSKLVRELLNMLANKKIQRDEYGADRDGYSEAVSAVQSAIWAITDFGTPSSMWKQEIEALPNR